MYHSFITCIIFPGKVGNFPGGVTLFTYTASSYGFHLSRIDAWGLLPEMRNAKILGSMRSGLRCPHPFIMTKEQLQGWDASREGPLVSVLE